MTTRVESCDRDLSVTELVEKYTPVARSEAAAAVRRMVGGSVTLVSLWSRSAVADEAVCEAMARLLHAAVRYHAGTKKNEGVGFGPYARQVVRNKLRKWVRDEKRQSQIFPPISQVTPLVNGGAHRSGLLNGGVTREGPNGKAFEHTLAQLVDKGEGMHRAAAREALALLRDAVAKSSPQAARVLDRFMTPEGDLVAAALAAHNGKPNGKGRRYVPKQKDMFNSLKRIAGLSKPQDQGAYLRTMRAIKAAAVKLSLASSEFAEAVALALGGEAEGA